MLNLVALGQTVGIAMDPPNIWKRWVSDLLTRDMVDPLGRRPYPHVTMPDLVVIGQIL